MRYAITFMHKGTRTNVFKDSRTYKSQWKAEQIAAYLIDVVEGLRVVKVKEKKNGRLVATSNRGR